MVQSYQGADYLSNSGPYSTMVCSSVVDLDKSSNLIRTDDFVHFIYPKEKQAIVGEGIMDDEDSSLHSEYVGILAKVISKKDIRVYQNENVMKTL